jgi:hypothetical protein
MGFLGDKSQFLNVGRKSLAYFFWSRERKSKISELRTIER